MYGQENIARVRRDEAEARHRQAEEERRARAVESSGRLAALRGTVEETYNKSYQLAKRERPSADNDSERDLQLVKRLRKDTEAPLFDANGSIDLAAVKRPERDSDAKRQGTQNETQGMRLVDAAGYGVQVKEPWYSSHLSEPQSVQESGRDVWGNDDPRRKDREQQRVNANDPLAAMKRGVKQLREAEAERTAWKAQRERDLNEVEELARQERRQEKRRRRRGSDEESIEAFNLDEDYGKDRDNQVDQQSAHKHRHRHHRRRHRHRDGHRKEHRRRSRSPRRRQEQ